jgi:hypothetical protein
MTENHPIIPTYELVEKWIEQFNGDHLYVATQAAQWGADQELEACSEWLAAHSYLSASGRIRVNRRPKPPSLKEQALEELDAAILRGDCFSTSPAKDIIRRALESIPVE